MQKVIEEKESKRSTLESDIQKAEAELRRIQTEIKKAQGG